MKICIDPGHGGADSGAVGTQPFRLEEKEFNLSSALLLDAVFGGGLKTAGVDQDNGVIFIGGLRVVSVPGDAGFVLHDGFALGDQPVEKGRFAHVGAAHDGDDRFHIF